MLVFRDNYGCIGVKSNLIGDKYGPIGDAKGHIWDRAAYLTSFRNLAPSAPQSHGTVNFIRFTSASAEDLYQFLRS